MRAKKIIVEIDGVRHRMIKSKEKYTCKVCSLNKFCANNIGCPCTGKNDLFILEK